MTRVSGLPVGSLVVPLCLSLQGFNTALLSKLQFVETNNVVELPDR